MHWSPFAIKITKISEYHVFREIHAKKSREKNQWKDGRENKHYEKIDTKKRVENKREDKKKREKAYHELW